MISIADCNTKYVQLSDILYTPIKTRTDTGSRTYISTIKNE